MSGLWLSNADYSGHVRSGVGPPYSRHWASQMLKQIWGMGSLEAGSASHLSVLYCVLSLLSLFCDVQVGRKCQNNNHMNPGPRFPCRTLQCNKMISLIYLTLLISTLKVMLVGSYRCTFPEGTEQLNLLFCVSGECKSNFHCFQFCFSSSQHNQSR